MSMSRILAVVLVAIGLVAAGTTMSPTQIPQQAGTVASTYTSMDGSGSGEPSSGPGQPVVGKNGEAWAWTQLTPRGTVIRFATTEVPGGCPRVNYTDSNGTRTAHSMIRVSGPYAGPNGSQFPTTVCRLPVPNGARDAVIDPATTVAAAVHPGTYRVPLPRWGIPGRPRPTSVVVIGDTGCETTATLALNQNCAQDWPFHRLAANAAATSRPDLVVHVGDYVYREAPQNANDATPGCNMQGQAADWACLVKDFFRPAEALLAEGAVPLRAGKPRGLWNGRRTGPGVVALSRHRDLREQRVFLDLRPTTK